MTNELQFQPYQMPSTATNMPKEFDQNFFNTLQNTLGSEYQGQANNMLGFQQSHNIADPGGNSDLLSQVLGSPQSRINSQIMPMMMHASAAGAGQQSQTQMQARQFQQKLQEMQLAFEEQARMDSLYEQLLPHGFSPSFGQTLGTGVATAMGQSPATAARMIEGMMSGGGGG